MLIIKKHYSGTHSGSGNAWGVMEKEKYKTSPLSWKSQFTKEKLQRVECDAYAWQVRRMFHSNANITVITMTWSDRKKFNRGGGVYQNLKNNLRKLCSNHALTMVILCHNVVFNYLLWSGK